MTTDTISLKTRWSDFRQQQPNVRIRDAARQLGVSEAELLVTGVGETVVRLAGDFRELLREVPTLGYVMALTRNDVLVHERKGVYEKVSLSNHMGLVLGPDIDLRLFMQRWQWGFAVNENDRRSLQFFDAQGEAIHKIYLTEQSEGVAYQTLVTKFRADDQSEQLTVDAPVGKSDDTADAAIDVAGFQAGWLAMQDTHEFFGLLRQYGVGRQQGLRLAPEGHARLLSLDVLKQVFATAADRDVSIMVFVSNAGCIQIHTGPVKKLVQMGPWYNVLDPAFNLHLNETLVGQVWLTKKPTADGLVTALELFDRNGQNVALVFGERKPGKPELESWRAVIADAVR
ncbi:hemin-degrading factor [Spirosoma utsteinense]|uniref:Hemin transport protein n=1 Tax=Spirosoma utsteinense TaxID=2585773 RepID=A0ABR6WAB3_9BACT|nr:ChuX/HutX family heme-like substrate-binding protein [Spirosoma utsteinense]MBC3787197.1 putative hemin transport protein [Spirosoma utsteinense]MBC3792882.1 putative hemin transport protein [Spirosoma utsteinense]